MKKQIGMEYRKLWNKTSWVAVTAMCLVAVLHLVVYLNLQWRTIDSNGEIIEGLASYRALKAASAELEGVMDGEYIKNLKDSYNSSFDKEYLAQHRGFLGTGGMTKYMVPNYFINYAYFGPYMSNGNEKVGLDYDFLESEETFYRAYKEAVKREWAEWNMYSEEQLLVLNQKADDLKTPFVTGYYQGLANLRAWYILDYSLVFVVLAFTLSGLFSQNNTGGITELTLASKEGRTVNLNARWVAGNLFTASVYLIYLGIQFLVNGIIGTLAGWNVSAQMLWFHNLYSMTIGDGLLIMFVGGLFGAVVVGNLVMWFSIRVKHVKFAAGLSVLAVLFIMRTKKMYGIAELFSPMFFASDNLFYRYLFLGKAPVPYFVFVLILTLLYVAMLYTGTRLSYRKYHIG